jgi:hypothetical protein
MSNENKVPVNLYGILDNELSRMHDLMRVYLALPKEDIMYSQHTNGGRSSAVPQNHLGEVYRRIVNLQDLLLQSLISHDKLLQERIAELALTGVKDEA